MVILDAGHGYDTPGKRSPVWSDGTQLLEWEFNRDVCRRVHVLLEKLGIPSVILVTEAIDITLPVRVQRVKAIMEKYKDAVGVSIHGNAALNPGEGRGWEVWTALEEKSQWKKAQSDRFATIAFATARALLPFKMRSDMTDGDPDKEGHFYILKNSPCPFILTENGFYDYEPDCRLMNSKYGKDLIAKMHAFAIETYLNLK